MKKLLLLFTIVGLIAFVGCKNKAPKSQDKQDVKQEVKDEVKEVVKDAGIPKFSSPEVTKGVKEWKNFMDEYIKAYEKKDSKKIQELANKQQEWTQKTQEWASKMTPEDAKKWSDFAQEYSQKMVDAMQ